MVTQKTSMPARKRGGISATIGEKVFDIFVYVFLAVCFFIWLFPLLYVVLASVTPYKDVVSASLVIIPSEITLDGYRFIFVNSNNDYSMSCLRHTILFCFIEMNI